MVTAETAVVLPVLLLLTMVAVGAVAVAQFRVRCSDAAMLAARAIARGDEPAAGRLAERAAGRSVRLTSSVDGPDTVVTARLNVQPVGWLPAFTLRESATVATEPATSAVRGG